MFRILFVCTGNICRSPMAEYFLKDLIKKENLYYLVQVESAGIAALEGYPAAEFAAAVCENFGIDTTFHRGRSVNLDMINKADLILCMGLNHKLELVKNFPHSRDKIFLLKQFAKKSVDTFHTIEDPYGGPKEDYEKTFLEIRKEIYRIWPELTRRIEEKWIGANTNRQ
jgi:protein-tyrosine-phosphatase